MQIFLFVDLEVPPLSSVRFFVNGFMLKSLIHLDLSFMQADRYGFICILLHVDIIMPAPFVEDAFFFPLYNFSFFFKNQVFICVWITVRVLSSIGPCVCFYDNGKLFYFTIVL